MVKVNAIVIRRKREMMRAMGLMMGVEMMRTG
jgi:hypothetical protein